MTVNKAYLLYGSYNSLVFTMPLLGGYLAEHFGYTRTLIIGPTLCIVGLTFIALNKTTLLYLGLATFVTGVGYFVPTLFVIVGKLYQKEDRRRDSGFTIQYIIFNVGCFLSTIISSALHKVFGYTLMFMVATVINLIGLFLYFALKHKIIPERGRVVSATHHGSRSSCWFFLITFALAAIAIDNFILIHPIKYDLFLFCITFIITLIIVKYAKQRSSLIKQRLLAFLMLSYFSIGFWALYTLEPSLLTIFIKNNVNRYVLGYLVPAQTFYSLDPIFIIILGMVLSVLWLILGKKSKEPSLPFKFFLSLALMAAGFFALSLGLHLNPTHLMNPGFIVICYVLLATAELCIAPIGYAMVGRLAPEGMEGRLMGVWQLFTGVAAAISGQIAQMANIPQKHTPLHASNLIYQNAFLRIGGVTFLIALTVFLCIPFLKKLITNSSSDKETAHHCIQ